MNEHKTGRKENEYGTDVSGFVNKIFFLNVFADTNFFFFYIKHLLILKVWKKSSTWRKMVQWQNGGVNNTKS